MRTLRLTNGEAVPALGQGTWAMGDDPALRRAEADALRLGLDLGLTLLDTAEMYADGGAEAVVADAIAGRRDAVFLVSKVLPANATRAGVASACARSLRRLRTDRLDLYLLHWHGSVPLAETVAGFEDLVAAGRIRHWGVSNLDVADLAALGPAAARCAADQVLYNLAARGIEFDLLPWCRGRGMPVMAYSPLGQGGALLRHPALAAVAARHGATPAQVALAWTLRSAGVIAIPKAADPAHVRANAAALGLTLTAADLTELDGAFAPPRRKQRLELL